MLGASTYRVGIADLPQDVTLTAVASDPDGNPLAAVDVTFTLSIPGIPTVTQDMQTDDQGRATFTTPDPQGRRPRPGQRRGAPLERGVRVGAGLHGDHGRARGGVAAAGDSR